ncbi:hepatitis A virus cellular receptor 2 isoform X1 [Trichechus manatus latirostris]|uniref:Hepatitis A virus cellular receptor 2 isoform X1 n=1 Tax=Trichechus manatus latirostris TaxID=127582 RepID=A0A2Y9QG57_TRIMA|nr:hepatitis A virus cellular receptor 2 isoform X1 [Trichechus manatus latirostris]
MGIISRQIISRVILWSRETVGGSTQFNWRIKLKLHRNRAILDSSVELMFSRLSFDCVLLLLPLLTRSLEGRYIFEVGQNAVLPCFYSPAASVNHVPVCWGQGSCPLLQCYNTVLSTDGSHINYQKSSRYQLKGYLHVGNVSLTIEKVTSADSGTYCCRVQFPGPMNDQKLALELVIIPAKVTTARTPRRNFTATVPRMLTTKGHGSAETQTRETLHGCNQTQKSTLANELQDPTVTTQITIYIGIGSSAGLALVLIFGALILKWYSHKKEKLQNSSLVSMANLPPSGFVNAVAAGMHSEENIYTIEENVYEVEDSDEYYCYISDWQRP